MVCRGAGSLPRSIPCVPVSSQRWRFGETAAQRRAPCPKRPSSRSADALSFHITHLGLSKETQVLPELELLLPGRGDALAGPVLLTERTSPSAFSSAQMPHHQSHAAKTRGQGSGLLAPKGWADAIRACPVGTSKACQAPGPEMSLRDWERPREEHQSTPRSVKSARAQTH